jgi:hypothetical protein
MSVRSDQNRVVSVKANVNVSSNLVEDISRGFPVLSGVPLETTKAWRSFQFEVSNELVQLQL